MSDYTFTRAIQTRFIGPTNTKGARMKALFRRLGETVAVTVEYNHGAHDPHKNAVHALIRKLESDYNLTLVDISNPIGETLDERGFIYAVEFRYDDNNN